MTSGIRTNIVNEAKKIALLYCEEEGLSTEKFKSQQCYDFGEVICFMQDMPYYGTGLREDIESQPKPTLIYHIDSRVIETTAYTEKYLS